MMTFLTVWFLGIIITAGLVFLVCRGGAWKLDDLLAWADEKDRYIREDLYKTSKILPHTTDIHKAARVLMTAQDMAWSRM